MTDKEEFLARLPMFQGLSYAEIVALARIAPEYAFTDNAVIAYQRDVADGLFILRSGRLFVKTVDERGIVRDSRSILANEYFGETWLFAPDVHPATVIGKEDGRLIIIRSQDFLRFLGENPQVLDNLEPTYDQSENIIAGLSEEAWAEAEKIYAKVNTPSTAVSLLPEELVEYYSRRSRFFLLLSLLPPAALLFIALVGTAVLLPQRPATGLGSLASLAVPLFIILFLLLWLALNYLDWRNDYFIITNKHLIHREFDLRRFRTNVVKISIDKVQSVEIEKPSLLANLFNIGTARVTTAAQTGVVYFDNIDDPSLVRDTLNRLSERVKTLGEGREQAVMRDTVEEHFRVERPLQIVPEVQEDSAETEEPPPFWTVFWRTLSQRYKWRIEDGKTITYHKHLFVLLRNIAWPAFMLLMTILLIQLLTRVFQVPLNQFWLLAFIFFTINLAWLVWQAEDWRNDTYQLTDRLIIDIDRRPFGFGESRKQAPLSNIQNVNASRPGLLPTLFNFGTVYVETAGVDADIAFENVPNPSQIQSDIFKRLDEFRQQQRINESAQRRHEYAVLLDVYKQATEQGRIPQRTPP